MKCPHCLDAFHEGWDTKNLGQDDDSQWHIRHLVCPSCKKIVVQLVELAKGGGITHNTRIVHPKAFTRPPVSPDVPDKYAKDYGEACLVSPDSPKASAALSRRTLQSIIQNEMRIKKRNLEEEIEEAIKSLPSHLAQAVDGVRVVGNFAAHPIKSTNTGEIVDVELGEADWLLDVLDGVFDFFFVQPRILERRKTEINKKLTDAGNPPLK